MRDSWQHSTREHVAAIDTRTTSTNIIVETTKEPVTKKQ